MIGMQEDANAAPRSAVNANQRLPMIDDADALSLSFSGPNVAMHGGSMFWPLMKEDEPNHFHLS